MKVYSFDEMVEKFGIGYYEGFYGIREEFCVRRDNLKPRPDDVKEQALKDAKKKLEDEIVRVNGIVNNILSTKKWYHKILGAIKYRKLLNLAKERLDEEREFYNKRVEQIKKWSTDFLPREDYVQHMPDVEVGDTIYIVATASHGTPLTIGVYPLTIEEKDWYIDVYGDRAVDYVAKGTTESGVEVSVKASEDNQLSAGWCGLTVHFTKEDAITHLRNYLTNQIKKLDEMVEKLEET